MAAAMAMGLLLPASLVVAAAPKSATDFACLQNTVERRDNSILAAVDGYSATVKSALGARRDALKAAFGTTDKNQRQAAVRNAWNTYKSIQRKARITFRDARNAGWQKFNTDRKLCGRDAAQEDATPSGVDAEL